MRSAAALQDWAAHSAMGRSGFLAAFSLIFLSEIGDKTFFLAAYFLILHVAAGGQTDQFPWVHSSPWTHDSHFCADWLLLQERA